VPAFATGGSGRRKPDELTAKLPSISTMPGLVVKVPNDLAEPAMHRLLQIAEKNGWFGAYERADQELYLLRSGPDAAQVQLVNGDIRIDASDKRQDEFRKFILDLRASFADDSASEFTIMKDHAPPPKTAPGLEAS
jgi:hypothetical protein